MIFQERERCGEFERDEERCAWCRRGFGGGRRFRGGYGLRGLLVCRGIGGVDAAHKAIGVQFSGKAGCQVGEVGQFHAGEGGRNGVGLGMTKSDESFGEIKPEADESPGGVRGESEGDVFEVAIGGCGNILRWRREGGPVCEITAGFKEGGGADLSLRIAGKGEEVAGAIFRESRADPDWCSGCERRESKVIFQDVNDAVVVCVLFGGVEGFRKVFGRGPDLIRREPGEFDAIDDPAVVGSAQVVKGQVEKIRL